MKKRNYLIQKITFVLLPILILGQSINNFEKSYQLNWKEIDFVENIVAYLDKNKIIPWKFKLLDITKKNFYKFIYFLYLL